jgi:uncharacterized membrane protein
MLRRILIVISIFFSWSACAFAQTSTLITDVEVFEKAIVEKVSSTTVTTIPGFDTQSPSQMVTVKIIEGNNKGKTTTFKNDYVQVNEGDKVYVRHLIHHADGVETWSMADPYRLDVIFWLMITFVVLIFIFGGVQGVRGLASLVGSIGLLFYVLIPGIYGGYNAVMVSIGVASLIIIVGSYITHGFNRTTSSAVLGMIATVIITGLGAYYVVDVAKLSGYSSDESMFLNLNARGAIDMVGLLFGGIMIGLLGVLYDSAIGQAVAIEELYRAGKHLTRVEVYKRGIRIGREHIGALVNTLAIAYVGASLPLFLLVQNATTGVLFIINSETFATEIVRILIGSIGLILAVPITTLIASYMLHGRVTDSGGGAHHHVH